GLKISPEASSERGEFHLLVVDDDSRLRSLLSRYLRDSGFLVSTVESVSEAEKALEFFFFDIIVLDVMMPGVSGLSFLENSNTSLLPPIILLTAQGGVEERIRGLSLGADDYVVKPFDPRELVLRIQVLLKRTSKGLESVSFGPLVFNKKTEILAKGDQIILLTFSEKKLLRFLLDREGTPLSREEIGAALGDAVNPRTVDVQINRLRQKIEPFPSQPRYIQSLRGQGYVLRVSS
ncbi:MAG: response regulator, partial [Holosporales bacterium]